MPNISFFFPPSAVYLFFSEVVKMNVTFFLLILIKGLVQTESQKKTYFLTYHSWYFSYADTVIVLLCTDVLYFCFWSFFCHLKIRLFLCWYSKQSLIELFFDWSFQKKKSVPWVYYPYSQHLLLEFEALWQQGQQEFNLLPLKI